MKKQIIASLAAVLATLGAQAQDYNIVVKTTDGDTHTFLSTGVDKIKFVEAPDYIDMPFFVSGTYSLNSDLGEYSLMLSDGSVDQSGVPSEVGAATLVLTFNTEKAEDLNALTLPEGYYRASSAPAVMTWNISKSGLVIRTAEGEDGVSTLPLLGGTVDVRGPIDGKYDIRVEVSPMGATEEMAYRYKGDMEFVADYSAMGGFGSDIEFAIEGVQGRFYSNWTYPFACDMTLELYTGTFDSHGGQITGYWVNMPINMPKVDNPMDPDQKVADGVYTVEPRTDVPFHTYFPFTMEKGHNTEFLGIVYPVGTYVTYKNEKGQTQMAFVTGGTMTVSNNGTKFDLDLIAENGIHIRAKYDGNVVIRNYCDNDKKEIERIDTLEGDYEMTFAQSDVATIWEEGDYMREGVGQYTVFVGDPDYKSGDFVQLALCSGMNGLENGTYTINDDIKAFGGIRGRVDNGGSMTYSTYGDFSSTTSDGVQEKMASIEGGTVTVERNGTKIKITFNLITLNGHKLTGTFDGPCVCVDAGFGAPAKKLQTR